MRGSTRGTRVGGARVSGTRLARARVGAVAVAALALLAAGCGSGSKSSPAGTFVPGATTVASDEASATPTTSGTPASRSNPLAQRVFKVTSQPKAGEQTAAVEAIEGYLDGLVTAFAINDVAGSGVRRWTSTGVYKQAQGTVDEQVKKGYVLYGPYVFTIDPSNLSSSVGVLNVCVDQSRTRRHNASTDKAGARNDTPYVRVDYTLSRDAGRWLVTSVKGSKVNSCPA